MKLKKYSLITILILFVIQTPIFAKPNSSMVGKDLYVSVEQVTSKIKPSMWGKPGYDYYYGDLVEVLEQDGSWCLVETKDGERIGWLRDSVLTSRKLKTQGNVSVDAKELALAGKGFSSPIEAEYSEQYDIDFTPVDEIETISIDIDRKLRSFIREGDLQGADE